MPLENDRPADEAIIYKRHEFVLSAIHPNGKICIDCKSDDIYPGRPSMWIPIMKLKYNEKKSTWLEDDQSSMYYYPDGSSLINVEEAIRRANDIFPFGPGYPRIESHQPN